MVAIVYTRYGSPDVLRLADVAVPVPGDDDVLLRILASTVSAEDAIFRRGRPFVSRLATGFFKPKHTILGSNLSGRIEAVGKNVTRFDVGDEVFGVSDTTFGAHAEFIRLAATAPLVPKPGNLSHAEAAAICAGGRTRVSVHASVHSADPTLTRQ